MSTGELEVEEKLHWLRICVDPWHLVESNWEATTNVRLATLQSKSGTVEEYLNLYPALKLPEGYRLVSILKWFSLKKNILRRKQSKGVSFV